MEHEVPKGLDNLLLMAAENDDLRNALLDRREVTLDRCEVLLTDSERKILAVVPRSQLEHMMRRLQTPVKRRAFFRQASATVVALLAGATIPIWVVEQSQPAQAQMTRGHNADRPREDRHCAIVANGEGGYLTLDATEDGQAILLMVMAAEGKGQIKLRKSWKDFKSSLLGALEHLKSVPHFKTKTYPSDTERYADRMRETYRSIRGEDGKADIIIAQHPGSSGPYIELAIRPDHPDKRPQTEGIGMFGEDEVGNTGNMMYLHTSDAEQVKAAFAKVDKRLKIR